VNKRDERTVGEQVKSDSGIEGWGFLLILPFIFLVLGSITLLLGKGGYTRLTDRLFGACGLAATSIAMLATVRHWVKVFVGALGCLAVVAVFMAGMGGLLLHRWC
jgi:hypothetical protein